MFFIPLSIGRNKFIHSLNYYFFLSGFLESLPPLGGSRMLTPFWCKHVDLVARSNEEEFENHGFSDLLLPLLP